MVGHGITSNLIPPGAEEFFSDGMPALRFVDLEGDVMESRITGHMAYEYRWIKSYMPNSWSADYAGLNETDCDVMAHDWLRYQWSKLESRGSVSQMARDEETKHEAQTVVFPAPDGSLWVTLRVPNTFSVDGVVRVTVEPVSNG